MTVQIFLHTFLSLDLKSSFEVVLVVRSLIMHGCMRFSSCDPARHGQKLRNSLIEIESVMHVLFMLCAGAAVRD